MAVEKPRTDEQLSVLSDVLLAEMEEWWGSDDPAEEFVVPDVIEGVRALLREVRRLRTNRELYGSPEVQRRLHKAEADRGTLQVQVYEQAQAFAAIVKTTEAERDRYRKTLKEIAEGETFDGRYFKQKIAQAALNQ